MRIALVAPPFIPVPPSDYGGIELFVAQLAEGLRKANVEVIVYANGESTISTELRSIYKHSEWPIKIPEHAWVRELNHNSWATNDASKACNIIHFQSAQGIAFSRFVNQKIVLTLHGPQQPWLSEYYAHFPDVHYVCISNAQCKKESLPKVRTIHHGIDTSLYRFVAQKQKYLSFIGRIAPVKGTHLAIDVARRSGIPLKIAGEVQPTNRDYFEKLIKPRIDGKLVEYVGPADLRAKNELLGNSMALLFPIQWGEPFGLVMIEAMACGTPVLAMRGGSVPEVVRDGISGYVCRSVQVMARTAMNLNIDPATVRHYVEENFSIEKMVRQYIALYQDALNTNKAPDAL